MYGVPPVVVTVTASFIVTVKFKFCAGPYVAPAGPATDEIEGPVRSIVTGVVDGVSDPGPFVAVTVP